jgi:hypothetical protein
MVYKPFYLQSNVASWEISNSSMIFPADTSMDGDFQPRLVSG